MAYDGILWTRFILEEFIKEGCLTEDQEKIWRTRCAGYTVSEQAKMLQMSVSNVNKEIRKIKDKYDEVQKHNPHLPPRRHSKQEDYMDNN